MQHYFVTVYLTSSAGPSFSKLPPSVTFIQKLYSIIHPSTAIAFCVTNGHVRHMTSPGTQVHRGLVSIPGPTCTHILPDASNLFLVSFSRIPSDHANTMNQPTNSNLRMLLPATGSRRPQPTPPKRKHRTVACENCRVKKTKVCRMNTTTSHDLAR